jgi:hypothetical protein
VKPAFACNLPSVFSGVNLHPFQALSCQSDQSPILPNFVPAKPLAENGVTCALFQKARKITWR